MAHSKPRQVAMQDLADFIMKQPKRRKLAMGDNTSKNSKCGLGCVMVQYGIEKLGITKNFRCTNATWYPSDEIGFFFVDYVIAEIEDGNIWNVCYNGEDDKWPYSLGDKTDGTTTYGELQNNISDKYEQSTTD